MSTAATSRSDDGAVLKGAGSGAGSAVSGGRSGGVVGSGSTSVSASKKAKATAAAAPQVRITAPVVVCLGLLVVAFAAMFWQFLSKQYGPDGFSVAYPQDWGHSYIVPLIAGWYVWKHRERIGSLPVTTFWPGVLLMVLGMVCYFNFIRGYPNHMFQGFSAMLTLAGMVLLLTGPQVFGAVLLPVAYLGFAVTISEMVMIKITFALQLLAAQGAWMLLNMVGLDTEIEGNVLRVFSGKTGEWLPLNVAEACAGMRMVIAFVALSGAVALYGVSRWWKRVALVLLSVPVALLMNIVRVAVLGMLSLVDPRLAEGEAHTLIGTALLVPAFGLFMLCAWSLNKIEPEVAS